MQGWLADLRIAAIRRSHKTRAQQLGCSVRPCKRIAPVEAIVFGVALGIVGISYLTLLVNPLTALLGAATLLSYIAVYTPFSMFLLRAYFIGLPTALEEAARLDGANELQVLWHVVVPLSKPAFLTVALIVGMWGWNEFMYAVTVLQQSSQLTVALTYQNFTQRFSSNLAEQNAAGLLLVLHIIVLYLLLQRRFIEGMTSGGLKL